MTVKDNAVKYKVTSYKLLYIVGVWKYFLLFLIKLTTDIRYHGPYYQTNTTFLCFIPSFLALATN